MIASSALESECVAAWNVEVTFMKLPKFRKPENWPNCLGCHALTSQSTASYHTHNERGDSGLSYEPKLWRIHWSGPEESAVSRSIKPGGAARRLFYGLMALPISLLVPGLGLPSSPNLYCNNKCIRSYTHFVIIQDRVMNQNFQIFLTCNKVQVQVYGSFLAMSTFWYSH